ncbi:MAG: hypothetical protein KatS3mg102_1564 [Planctomycetota bacterium]|nr:MAG: hypothetical protein KatS3mg102_1564 [Planctomycetota bacterium]
MRMVRKLGLLFVPAVLALASGCIKAKQHWTVYPDGSGKVEIENTLMGMMAQMVKMGAQMAQQGGEGADPFEMIKDSVKGEVYWTDLQARDGPDGSYILSGTAYFTDISKVATGEQQSGIEFRKNDDGSFTLTFKQDKSAMQGLPGMSAEGEDEQSPEEKAQQEQMKAMMMGMLAGFEMQIAVTMPGAVSSVEGFGHTDGRSASFTIGEEQVKKYMAKQASPPDKLVVTSAAPGPELEAEFAAFQKALAKAKAEAEAARPAEQGEQQPEEAEGEQDAPQQPQGGTQPF